MNAVEDFPLVEEFDLGFGRVDVHIHTGQGHGEVQHTGGKAPDHELIAVGLLQRGGEGLGVNQPLVHIEKLVGAGAPRCGGSGDKAGEPQRLPLALDRHHLQSRLTPQHRIDGGQQRAVAGGVELALSVLDQPEGDFRVGEGLLLHGACRSGALDGIALHKLHPGRGIEEEVAHHNRRADRTARLLAGQELPALEGQMAARQGVGGAGQKVDPADGCRRRQRLAPEAEGTDGLQVLSGAKLGGGVAEEGRLRVLPAHAAAVVADAQEGHAAVLQLHRNRLRPGVDGILDQLLDHGGRPLHDLARSNQIRQMRLQLDNLRHKYLLFCITRQAFASAHRAYSAPQLASWCPRQDPRCAF